MAGATANSASSDQNINGLLQSFKWNSLALTYNFPIAATYYPYPATGPFPANGAGDYFTAGIPATITFDIPGTFEAATTALVTTIEWAQLNQFSAVTPMTFGLVGTGAVADKSYGMADLPNFGGVGYGPGSVARGGDAWFDSLQQSGTRFDVITRGDADWRLVLHEVGHTLGLKHGHEAGGIANVTMISDRDSMEFSVMTYRKYVGADPNNDSGIDVEPFGFAQTLMMYDIAALQHMYGANFSINSTSSSYTWSPTTGELFINGIGQGAPGANRIFMTIWDGNGIDTYDLSNYATNLAIDLTPGGWSSFDSGQTAQLSLANNIFARGNVFNALQYQGDARSLIENANGGSGNDSITGNAAANTLNGNGGGDTLIGGAGNDTLNGGAGADSISGADNNDVIIATHDDGVDTISGGNGFDILDFSAVNGVVQINQLAGTITGSAGNDVLADVIEQIKGTAFDDVLSGGHGINVLDGEGGHDQFFGNNGDDLMRGGTGGDTFYFSLNDGNDSLLGGDGFDVLDYSSLGGVVQINQLAGTTTGSANNDVLQDVFEMVIGTAFGDVLSGGHGGNSLKGNGGDDQFFANNGDDYMSGGTGNDTLTGGVGNDTQDVRNGEGVDTWLDFTAGGTEDTITLTFYSGLGITTFAQLEASGRLSTVSGHAELALNGGDKIIFNNVASHLSLTAADFIF